MPIKVLVSTTCCSVSRKYSRHASARVAAHSDIAPPRALHRPPLESRFISKNSTASKAHYLLGPEDGTGDRPQAKD